MFSEQTLQAMRDIRAALHEDVSNSKPAHLILAGVLSSPIDADKISYPVDDANESGVSYGKGVDIDGILGALMPPRLEDISDRPTIGLSEKGIAAAESIAMARQHMVRRVYWRHTNRSTMAMVKYGLSRLLRDRQLDFSEYLENNFFVSLSEATKWVFSSLQEVLQENEVNPIGGMLERERRFYRHFLTIPNGPDERQESIHLRLRTAGYEEMLNLEHRLAADLSEATGRNIRKGEVLLDVPVKDRGAPGGTRSARVVVYSKDPRKSPGDITQFTPWLANLRAEHEGQANKARVFLAPQHYRVLDEAHLQQLQRSERCRRIRRLVES